MTQFLDGLLSYVLAIFLVMFGFLVTNSSAILTLGGILLLAIRLYADGKRAYREWKGDHTRDY
jgi:hypothetical protein